MCNGNGILFRFYEWKKDGSKKQPYYVHFKDGRPLVFAALYDSWKNSEDRMPVILGDKESTETWLIGSSSSKFDTVLKPYEAVDLVWYPVTPAIGKASFDGPECIKEIKLKSEATYPISKFFSKKGANSEQESKPQVGSMHKLPIKTNQRKSLKEEPETEDDVDCPSLTEESSDGSKPNVSTLSDKAAANLPIKREYEEFSADMKPCIGETNKPQISPPKKKGNLGAAGDKQPTLFSYFGKK
ncbi:putative peptidase YMR114C isoform X2 [Camellia sinensis]|uniref:putative peptidase YMR114C isoform X2 n=1 Tax=Camellia sinensis TaxID=4442 RepID=UPI0010369D6D|nr:putative peptidase YMR114C isoform X2 [Camellia sinensis]